MAEYVQLNLETMLLELETMEKIKLFTQDEVRRIIKKRKEFEYKLQRGTKYKEDMLNYIRYEWDLLVVVKSKTLPDKSTAPKRNKIAHSISQHIQRLFTETLRKFGSDVKLWLSYIDFCLQLKMYPAMSRTLEKMLELHKDKPELFCTAAQTEFNVLGSMDRARMIFLNGIRLHKESELLYREAFALELSYAKKMRKEFRDKDEPLPDDPLLEGQLAKLLYESSKMSIRSIDLMYDLLMIAKKYRFAAELKDLIFKDIVEMFEDKELRWDIVAHHELENSPEEFSAKDSMKACVAVYEEAVKKLNTPDMWSLYIDTMLMLNEDLTYLKNFKINCLMQAFLQAHCAGKLKEGYYLKWASKLDGEADKEKKRDVLKSSTEQYPGSVKLWEEYLMALASMRTPWNKVYKAFCNALSQLKSRKVCSVPLWKFIVSYVQLNEPAKTEDLMREGIKQGGEVSVVVRTLYLEWLVLSRGLKAARKAYSEYANFPPFSLDFHRKMIEVENYSVSVDTSKIRKAYEMSVSQFGKDNAEVWIDYIKFEQNSGDPTKVPDLYSMAIENLQPGPAENFMALFFLYKIEMKSTPEDEVFEPVEKKKKTADDATSTSQNRVNQPK